MFTEEKKIQALKNFSFQEMFASAGLDPNLSLTSENELNEGSFHSASDPTVVPEMHLNAEPYLPDQTNFQSTPVAKCE